MAQQVRLIHGQMAGGRQPEGQAAGLGEHGARFATERLAGHARAERGVEARGQQGADGGGREQAGDAGDGVVDGGRDPGLALGDAREDGGGERGDGQ